MIKSREGGIEFGDVRQRLRGLEYPRTGDDVIAACGDETVAWSGGAQSVETALEPCRDHTFESAGDVETTLFSMAPIGAVGRSRYTDRGCLSTTRSTGSL